MTMIRTNAPSKISLVYLNGNSLRTVCKEFILIQFLLLLFGLQPVLAFEAFDNGLLRFGTGSEASVNTLGNLQQPFYFDTTVTTPAFLKLTFSNFPLDNNIGLGGDGTNDWNNNGTLIENGMITGQVLDVSGFVVTSGSRGYGTIISTGTLAIGGINLEFRNTYELGQNDAFMKITTRLTNQSATPATNLRIWVGTRDDFVGTSDRPTKERGNLVDGAFAILTNAADQAAALRITSATSGVLFFSTSPRAEISIQSCCSFSNSYNQDPNTSAITATNDGSYAMFVRMNDLANGESDEFSWFYAAGAVGDLDTIAANVAAASVVAKTNLENGDLSFTDSDFTDTNGNPLTMIRISALTDPLKGVLKVSGVDVTLNQVILNADFPNLTYTPVPNFTGDDSFSWEAFVSGAYLAPTVANISVIGLPDAPTAISAVPGATSAAINFTPPADDGNDTITAFTASCNAGTPDTGSASPLTVTGLTAGTVYSCSVIATNSVGDSPASNIVLTSTLALTTISTYADDNTQTIPSVQNYIDAPVTGVTATNLAIINAAVDETNAAGVTTAAQIQALVNALNTVLAEVVEDIAGNTNATPTTAVQLNSIPGVSGAIPGVDYSAALAAGSYVDSGNPTPAEIQAVISAINAANVAALAEVVEDIAGNTNATPVTATQLNAIFGVSGAITGADYSTALAAGTYVDTANPTAAEIQTVIDAVNAVNTASLAEVVEDIAGNTNSTPVTVAQLNGIPGVSGAIAGADYTTALAAGTYADSANPTALEIQTVINAVNAANTAALAEVVEDIAGNTNTTPVTAAQLNGIPGVSGAVAGADYSTALAAGTYIDPANPTAAEIQTVIDAVNAANTAAISEVVEDIAGNTNATPVTAAQLNGIPGVSGAVAGADYTSALAAGTYADSANPTAVEIQAVIDAVNAANTTALAEVVEDIAGNTNMTPVTAAQLNGIPGVSGAIDGADYTTALAAGAYVDSANPTAAEIQTVIDAVNATNTAALAEVVEDIAGNTNTISVTAAQLNGIPGVSGAIGGADYTTALATGAYADPANPTAAEIQAVIDAVNAANGTALAEVVEDIAGNANATPVTSAQLNAIPGVSGAIVGADYATALATGTYVDSANPTAAEIQAVINAVNAANAAGLAEVTEDIAGNTNATPVTDTQLNAIIGVSGALPATDYTTALAAGSYVDSANPTPAEIQAVIDSVNATNAASAAGVNEVVEDIAGNTNTTPVTDSQLNAIIGVSGAVPGADYTTALAAGTYVDPANPTAAEIQTVIDAVNATNTASLAEVVEDIAGNTNTTPVTAAQLNGIPGVSGAIAGADYATALATGTYVDPANPTAVEIQTVIDAVNAANTSALGEVVEDIAGNTNTMPVTATQLNGIPGVSGAVTGADYATALATGTYVDPANPTAAEIQTVIDAVNAVNAASLAEVVEDIAGNTNTTPVTAAQLNGIPGVTGAVAGADYATALAAGSYVDPANPTAAEIQAVIDAVNGTNGVSLAEVVEDIAGNTNAVPASAGQLNGIPGVSGAVAGADYATALAAGTYVDPANPTAAEIQTVIDAVNAANAAALAEVVEDIAGNTNTTPVTADELNGIPGVTGAINGEDYATALAAGTYVDPANPTPAEIQAVIDAVNATSATIVAALAEVVEDIAGNANTTSVTATQLNGIPGISGAVDGADYTTALAAGTYADPANPTSAEIQSVINSVNAANVASSTGLGEVIEDIAGNINGITVSATQLNDIAGVTGAENGADYTAALSAGTYADPANPTAAEIQVVVDAVNAANAAALAEVVEDISGNPNTVSATADELNAIPGVEGAIDGVDYSSALAAGIYADPANPTKAEIQEVIDAVNSDNTLALAEVVEDIAGNTNTIPVTAIQLNALPGVGGALDGVDYSTALAAGTYADPANPTAAEIQAVIDSVAGGSTQSFTGNTATGTGTATATISGGGATCAFDPTSTGFVPTSTVATGAPTSNEFIHGLFSFRLIQCTPASTVDITISWPGTDVPAGSELWKFGPSSSGAADSWFQPASAVINSAANEITYTVVNNGAGDRDNDPNVIVDPVGLAVADGGVAGPTPIPGGSTDPAQPIPTLSEWAQILLAMLIGAVTLLNHRRRDKVVVDD